MPVFAHLKISKHQGADYIVHDDELVRLRAPWLDCNLVRGVGGNFEEVYVCGVKDGGDWTWVIVMSTQDSHNCLDVGELLELATSCKDKEQENAKFGPRY